MTTPSDSTIARTLDDRAIEVAATELLGLTHCHRGEFNDAARLLERNVALWSELHIERVGPFILPAHSQAMLSYVLAQLGRFDEATGYADAAVRLAQAANHPFTLYFALFHLGSAGNLTGPLSAFHVLTRRSSVRRTLRL